MTTDMALERPFLKVVGLCKVFGSSPGSPRGSLDPVVGCWDVSFVVNPGEMLGIIGESGSGKTTLLRNLAGDQTPDSGEAYLRSVEGGDRDLFSLTAAERRRLRVDRIGMVYQDPELGLAVDLSAGANVVTPLAAIGWRHFGRMRARASELLERVELPLQRMDDPISTYSGGMKQRVQVAKALANLPGLLLLDEPTTGLDASVAAGVLDLIRDLQDELRLTGVIVSHDMRVIATLARRVIVMQHGKVVESGLTDQLLEDPQDPYSQQLVAASR